MSKLPLAFLLFISSLPIAKQSQGIWYESQGQAAIENGNKAVARQNATQEAIKQALLFAGASIKSVQRMANGLLEDDQLEIRAAGEVNQIELIEERYSDGFVTVAIRADIFSQQKTCDSSDYKKTIATTYHPITHRQQATVGQVFDLGVELPNQMRSNFIRYANHSSISHIAEFYPAHARQQADNHISLLARRTNSQYVLLAQMTDISVTTVSPSGWALWESSKSIRNFGYQVNLYDGQTGASMWSKQYLVAAPWGFKLTENIDVASNALWQSEYGRAIDAIMQDISQNVDEAVSCLPAYGRVLHVQNEELKINIGENQGVRQGDELTLFQVKQFHDPQGHLHSQYSIHPSQVEVIAVYPQSAVAIAADGRFLANIQPNDFVARQ